MCMDVPLISGMLHAVCTLLLERVFLLGADTVGKLTPFPETKQFAEKTELRG